MTWLSRLLTAWRDRHDPYAVMQTPPDMSSMRYDFAKAAKARRLAESREIQRRKLEARVSQPKSSPRVVPLRKSGSR